MTTAIGYSDALIAIVADLSSDLPSRERYQRLLEAILSIFPCDAAALLQLEGRYLRPLAMKGLREEAMGRRFAVDQQPRLASLVRSQEPVRFAADSGLADPYDGLVIGVTEDLDVHDCMGVALHIDQRVWGVLTLDALAPGSFDNIDPVAFRTFISLTEATIKAALRIEALEARVERGLHVVRALQQSEGPLEMIGESSVMLKLKEEIAIVAKSQLTVLVLGETGVGKELVARQVHLLSVRADRPLVYVNCAALPESIAESELFGHVKGAFTGALADRAGKFEIADGSTLFLDEIGELPLAIQAKLLRALQSGEIQRVGSDNHIRVNVRIVAATNRDLQKEVTRGRFRADLFHRLSVYPVNVPPLRERGRDLLLIAGFLLEADQVRLGVQGLRLDSGVSDLLLGYEWPGNVRELQHLLSRAALKAVAEQGRDSRAVFIKPSHLDIYPSQALPASAEPSRQVVAREEGVSLKVAMEEYEKRVIADCLSRHAGNHAAAARSLGVEKSNFYRLLRRLGL